MTLARRSAIRCGRIPTETEASHFGLDVRELPHRFVAIDNIDDARDRGEDAEQLLGAGSLSCSAT